MFERDQRGLRGPVKSCTEETTHPSVTDGRGRTYPEVHSEFTTEYDSDGRVLATRSSNTRNSGGQWVSFYEYDASGRLLKVASGVEGKALTETIYSYDQQGRLQSIRDGARPETPATFSYDERGRKTKIEISRPADYQPNTMVCGSAFETAARAPNLQGGGTSTTIFDEHDRPTEAQVRDANGEVVTRTLRTYDAEGRVIEEKEILDNPELLFPSEGRAKIVESGVSEDQHRQELREGILKFMGGPEQYWFSNRYDTRGRISHTSFRAHHRHHGEIEITYNEHGDRESEIGRDSPLDTESDPKNATPSTSYSETRYSYKYDQHNNWIEKVESRRSSPDSPFELSPTVIRTFAYY